jgi:hypothetical protein
VVVLNKSLDFLGFFSDFLFNGVCRVIVDIAYYYFPFMIYETHLGFFLFLNSCLLFENKKGGYLI